MTEEVPRRTFDQLTIRLGNAATFKQGKSPNWEVYAHPFHGIVDSAKGALPMGRVVLALALECWGDLSQRTHLLGGMNTEGKKGTLQIEHADGYIAILRQWKLP